MKFLFQCTKSRSVCTVTSLAVDDRSVAAGLGSSGRVTTLITTLKIQAFELTGSGSRYVKY